MPGNMIEDVLEYRGFQIQVVLGIIPTGYAFLFLHPAY